MASRARRDADVRSSSACRRPIFSGSSRSSGASICASSGIETRSIHFRRTLARQFDAIAYRITGGGRADVASVYRAALAEDPALWRELSWARVLALLLFGRDGRARLGTSAPARALRAIRQSHHG
jgi:hypothetical protein